jgi:hypothetical protein
VREYLKHIRDEIAYLEAESEGVEYSDFTEDETQIKHQERPLPEDIAQYFPIIE